MTKTIFAALLLFHSILCVGQSTPITTQKGLSSDRPNIIFILTDDQRWDALGYAGNPNAHTPEMDQLAQSGVFFKKAIVTTPICAASRASIFTGLHERSHRYTFQTGAISEEYMAAAYPKRLKDAGYHTGFYGKFGVKYPHLDQLFDVYESYDRGSANDHRGYFYKTLDQDTVHLTRYTGQQALNFIEQAPKDKPFCLSLSFSAPHAHDAAEAQYFWQAEVDHLYQGVEMPSPILAEDTYFDRLPQAVRDGFNRTRWYWRYDTPEKYQHSVKGYYRMIAGIDAEIGKIRQQLKAKGLDKNTVIILMGDNGYFMGERQLAGKWLLYDNSIRVPLIFFDPRQGEHRDIEEMVLNIDVPATVLDLAKVDIPQTYQGKSLYPLATNPAFKNKRDTILIEHLWEFENIPPSEGLRTKDWKYFRYCNDHSIEELYALADDPLEINNLSSDPAYQKKLLELRKKCNELMHTYSDDYSAGPNGLMVDFIRKPEKVTLKHSLPAYSWIVPQNVGFQKAYQILVSSSPEKSGQNLGDIWDSGRIRSSQSTNIKHEGKALMAKQTYYWKVRIWDDENRLRDYSPSQTLHMGLAEPQGITENTVQIAKISPAVLQSRTKTNYFVDFGKAAFATLQLHYTAPKNDTLLLHLGEQLTENGHINRQPQGHIRYQAIKLPVYKGSRTYQIAIQPDKRNTSGNAVMLPDSFPVLMPFRYCELENVRAPLTKNDILQIAYFGYFDDTQSHFSSSDTILNQVWELCKYSLKATTFAGVYVDGDRERIPYEADAYLNQLGHYSVDQEYPMARRTMAYFMDHPTWPTEWLLHNALMFEADYLYTGNTDMIAQWYAVLKAKTLMELARPDGLISSQAPEMTDEYMHRLGFSNTKNPIKDIVDWPPAQKDTGWKLATPEGERDGFEFKPINTVVNCFFYKNMEIMAKFAHLLDKPADELAFQLLAIKVKKAINEKLFDQTKGVYLDGEGASHASLHSNMMALAFDIVPEKYIPGVANFIKSRGMACSVYGSQYLMEALYKAGEAAYALDLMTATNDRSWWNMIKVGSTITLEAWDMKYKPNSDWNHAWGAAPANIIPRHLWGIQPIEPGFAIFQIKPQLASLTNSQITVPTIKGTITAAYKRQNRLNESYQLEIPGNTLAKFILSQDGDKEVILNGKKTSTVAGFILLEPGRHTLELRTNTF